MNRYNFTYLQHFLNLDSFNPARTILVDVRAVDDRHVLFRWLIVFAALTTLDELIDESFGNKGV